MTDPRELETGSEDGGGELLFFADEFGLLVQGPQDVAKAAIDRLLEGSEPAPGARRRLSASDAAGVGVSGVALAATSGEYLRLTAESAAKIAEYGAQFDSSGALRGWVRDGQGFAGQLVFQPVSLAAEQALALQTAAVSLALRSAIANVQKAVERVEGKVDKINRHLDSRLRGDVIGTYHHLQQVADATNERRHLLQADWDSVSSVRNQLARDLETMREYVKLSAETVTRDLSVPKREDMLKAFHKSTGGVADVLTLILVAEQSLHLFEYLRIQQVRRTEPDHIESALADARVSLRYQHEQDEALVEALRAALERAWVVDALEIHHVFSSKRLDKHARILDERVREFAESSRLTPPEALGARQDPTLADARRELQDRTVAAGRTARALGSGAVKGGARAAMHGGRKVEDAVRSSAKKIDWRQKKENSDE